MTPRTYASQPSTSAVMAPWSFPFHDPDQWRGGELAPGEAGTLVGFGVGCLPGVLEAAAPVTTHDTNIRFWAW